MLNGVMKVDKIVKKAKELGMPAVALTDNGSMYPAVSFWQKCLGEGIKPIFGVQVNISPRSRHDKEPKKDEKTHELVLLAKNLAGYHNIIKLISIGHLEGFYYKPRIDNEVLEQHKEGLIVLSGGENGEIFKNFYLGNNDKAKEVAENYKRIFGEDFYIEVQRTGIHAEEVVEPKLRELGKELEIELVATNNTYYEKEEDAEAREVLWCIDSGRLMSDPSRRKPESNQNYFKSIEEMEKLFEDFPEAIKNTEVISNKIEEFSISYGKVQPVYPKLPDGETEESYLRKMVFENAEKRFGYWNEELEKQINYELEVIHDKGYDGYFLVVWDVANWAHQNDVSVNARGSAAGTAIGYALGIASVDPLKWKLFFERFLNPERKSLPDIDLDIADNKRDELIHYIKETYGNDCVVNVGALGKLTTKAAIRDVGRVLGVELSTIDKLSKLVPVKFGRVVSINGMIADELAGKELKVIEENREKVTEFREIIKEDGNDLREVKFCEACQKPFFDLSANPEEAAKECKSCHGKLKVIAQMSQRFIKHLWYVQKIEGCIRNVSTHACGYLITAPNPITNFCPIQKESGSRDRIITQFEGKYLEEVGLMKFDFLGVANLSIIDNAVKMVKEYKGVDLDIYHLPEDDKKTFDLFRRADTTAIFQLESGGMKKYLKELEPQNLEEISAMLALYRPGPMQYIPAFINRKFGREEVKYLIPEIEDIMQVSYGLPVYQEQILQIANRVAGYSLGQADNLRRAIGKKLPEVMAAEEKNFKEGFLKNYPDYGEEVAQKLWEYALPFADYGFNKSHTAAYALISYQTAYLKANYPTEFEAALMLSDIDNLDKLVRDIVDAEARGITILPPSINESDVYFTIKDEGVIRFGIGGLKGVGIKAIQSIVGERNKNGTFSSLDNLCERIDHKAVSKGAIEALIKVGALEEFGKRAQLLQVYEDIYVRCQKSKTTAASGFIDMFSSADGEQSALHNTTKLPAISEVDDAQKREWETQILGIAITPSLMNKLTPYLQSKNYKMLHEIKDPSSSPESTSKVPVKLFGEITRKNVITTKNGDEMCFVEIADATDKINITIFPRNYAKCDEFEIGEYLNVKGKTQERNGEIQVIADDIKVVKDYEVKTLIEKWNKSAAKKEGGPDQSSKSPVEKPGSLGKKKDLTDSKNVKAVAVSDSKQEYKPDGKQVPVPQEQPKESLERKIVEIFVKKDAPIDELKAFSAKLKESKDENGIEVFLHLPNHESIRKIKLEGRYSRSIAEFNSKVIENVKTIVLE